MAKRVMEILTAVIDQIFCLGRLFGDMIIVRVGHIHIDKGAAPLGCARLAQRYGSGAKTHDLSPISEPSLVPGSGIRIDCEKCGDQSPNHIWGELGATRSGRTDHFAQNRQQLGRDGEEYRSSQQGTGWEDSAARPDLDVRLE